MSPQRETGARHEDGMNTQKEKEPCPQEQPQRETRVNHKQEKGAQNEKLTCPPHALFPQESPGVLSEPNTRLPDEKMGSPAGDKCLNQPGEITW